MIIVLQGSEKTSEHTAAQSRVGVLSGFVTVVCEGCATGVYKRLKGKLFYIYKRD